MCGVRDGAAYAGRADRHADTEGNAVTELNPESNQIISIIVCIVGIIIWLALMKIKPQFFGWFLLPISVFIVNGSYYAFVLLTDLRTSDLDLYLFIGSWRTLYSLLILVIASGVMLYELRKRAR